MARLPKGVASVVACEPQCSLHPNLIGQANADAIRAWVEEGDSYRQLAAKATELLGRPVDHVVMYRHGSKHFRELASEPSSGGKVGDLEILDSIISAGFKNSKNWKPSIKDTLDAMKLKLQITGNSAFDDMLAAMESGLGLAEGIEDEEDEAAEANLEAVLSPDERPTEDAEELEEPAL